MVHDRVAGAFLRGRAANPVELFGLRVYAEGALHGAAQSLRFLALLGAGLAVALSTPPDRMAAALARLGVSPALALVATAALGSAPVVLEEWRAVRAARARRGRPAWRRSPWAWLVLEASLARPVAARALRRAQVLGESLDARGFDAGAATAETGVGAGAWPWAGAGLAVGVAGAALAARLLFLAYASGLYYEPALRPLYAWVRAWM